MLNKVILLFTIITGIIYTSCTPKNINNMVPVAEVYGKVLYLSDIKDIFPEKVTKQDSIELATSYINTWIKTQLLLRHAENNLTPEQLDIEKQLDAYKSQLLIYKYEQQMVSQKVDTFVKDSQIEEYYKTNTANFILDQNLVKALFIKIPKTAPNIDNVKKWYKSENKDDLNNLDVYCYNYAKNYTYFNNDWILFGIIQRDLPQKIENEDEFLKNNSNIEKEDSTFVYLVTIKDKTQKGSLAPLPYVKTKIKDIIINKRKVSFLNELEKNIFNDAQSHFKIYNLDKN